MNVDIIIEFASSDWNITGEPDEKDVTDYTIHIKATDALHSWILNGLPSVRRYSLVTKSILIIPIHNRLLRRLIAWFSEVSSSQRNAESFIPPPE